MTDVVSPNQDAGKDDDLPIMAERALGITIVVARIRFNEVNERPPNPFRKGTSRLWVAVARLRLLLPQGDSVDEHVEPDESVATVARDCDGGNGSGIFLGDEEAHK